MKITTLYEPANTDGYHHYGSGLYHSTLASAERYSRSRYGEYSVAPIERPAVETEDGRYLLLKSPQPVCVADTTQHKKDVAKKALDKLTPEERDALGVS